MNKAVKEYLNKHGFEAFCPKAVLFDMDGVLYDSMPNHAVAWHESMAKFGIDMTQEQAYATEGQRGIDTIKQMVMEQQGRRIYTKTAQKMYDEKTRIFHQMPEPPIMNGIPALMAKLHSYGLSICVVTGSGQRPLVARLLRDFGEYLRPELIVTAYDVKHGKPHPEPYLMGLKKAGNLKPWEAIVVENAPLGVQAGVAADIFTICVNTGHLPIPIFKEKGANLVFEDMNKLCAAWEDITIDKDKDSLSQDYRWNRRYQEVMNFIHQHGHRPSKYVREHRHMINWIKYNRKLMAAHRLPTDRMEKFAILEDLMKEKKRINQYAFFYPKEGDLFT